MNDNLRQAVILSVAHSLTVILDDDCILLNSLNALRSVMLHNVHLRNPLFTVSEPYFFNC